MISLSVIPLRLSRPRTGIYTLNCNMDLASEFVELKKQVTALQKELSRVSGQ